MHFLEMGSVREAQRARIILYNIQYTLHKELYLIVIKKYIYINVLIPG